MKKIAKFEKVSKQQFEAAWEDTFGEKQSVYNEIKLPEMDEVKKDVMLAWEKEITGFYITSVNWTGKHAFLLT